MRQATAAATFTEPDVAVHKPESPGLTSDPCKWRTELRLTIRRGRRGASPSNIVQLIYSRYVLDLPLVVCSSVNRDGSYCCVMIHLHEKKGFGLVPSMLRKYLGQ